MKTQSRSNNTNAWALSLLVLLALAAFAPLAGGFLQKCHRSIRQGMLRRSKTELAPVRLILTDKTVAKCFFPKENELEYGGLRYDVVSVHREGNCFIFSVMPDVKETRICSLTLRSILFPSKNLAQKTSIALPDYLICPQGIQLLPQEPATFCAWFNVGKVVQLAGFEWMFAPPPDVGMI